MRKCLYDERQIIRIIVACCNFKIFIEVYCKLESHLVTTPIIVLFVYKICLLNMDNGNERYQFALGLCLRYILRAS